MRFLKTQIMAAVNQKGGSGKTSTASSLAAAFAQRGLAVCLIDADEQCNATQALGLDQDELDKRGALTIADIYLKAKPAREAAIRIEKRLSNNLSIIRGHRGLGSVEKRLESDVHAMAATEEHSPLDQDDIRHQHRLRLRKSLETLPDTDIIIIDTPPSLGFIMTTALIAADWFIVPLAPSKFDLAGLEMLLGNAKKVERRYNPALKLLGVVLSRFNARAKLDQDVLKNLKGTFGDALFLTAIHESVKHREATFYGRTIIEHAPEHQAATQYIALADEVIGRMAAKTEEPLPDLAEAQNG